MAFDPSVIASIGDNAPDITGSQAKAYTLADMIDTNQLRKGQVADDKQNRADQEKVRDILKNSDISTYEGKLKAGEAITKVSPKMGMDFVSETNKTKGQSNELSQQQYQLLAEKNDVIGGAAVGLKTMHDQLAKQGKNEAEINAAMMPQLMQTMKQLETAKLPDGTPVLSPEDRQQYEQNLGKGYNPAFIDTIVGRSKQASEVLKTKLAERKEDVAERHQNTVDSQEAERERHDRTTETQGQEKIEATRRKIAEAHANFEGKNGDLMAAMAERGVSLPAGFRSKDQQVALLNSLIKRNPDASVDQIADKVESGQISLSNYKVEGRVAAGVAGKVAYAENEIEQTIPLVREASKNLPRGQFVPYNKLMQMGQAAESDPNLKEFKAYMTSLSNAYDMLSARGGTDADKRSHNRELFNTADSPEALERVLTAVQNEARASGKAADATMIPANQRAPGTTGAAPTQTAAGVTPAPGAIGAPAAGTPPAGNVVHWDDLK